MGGARGTLFKVKWLRKRFEADGLFDDPVVHIHLARAFLLYTLGYTLFNDKRGNRVRTTYLEFLQHINRVHTYAWGAAALAFLYRALGQGNRVRCKQMVGYSTLLETWIYERFPAFRPTHNIEYRNIMPRVQRWKPWGKRGLLEKLQAHRELLNSLTANDSIWNPYSDMRQRFPFPRITLYHGCLLAVSVVEPYHPNQVFRQFGYVQTIPSRPIDADITDREKKRNQGVLMALVPYFRVWNSHVLSIDYLDSIARPPALCAPEYFQWCHQYSYPIIQNPEHRSPFISTAAAVRVPDAWEMVRSVRNILQQTVRRWRSGDQTFSIEELGLVINKTYTALDGPDDEGSSHAGRNDTRPSHTQPRRRRVRGRGGH